ncbi:glycosyl hydrolase family 95 catalytic domain-containing protein [Phocaeicola sp.]
MKKHFYLLLLLCLCTWGKPATAGASNPVKEHIDWPGFMQKQDLVWEVLPEYWYESSYMGNGKLGLMIYKEPKQNYIRFETGNCDVHDHRPGGGLFNVPRLLTGHFALYPEGEITGGTMRLDLWNAETTAQITTTKGTIDIHAFVHANDMLILVNTTASKGEENFRWEWVPASADSPRWLYAKANPTWGGTMPKTYDSNPAPEVKPGMSIQKLPAGGETAVAWQETSSKPNEHTYWISLVHSYPELTAEQESRQILEQTRAAGYKKLQKTHRAWWNAFYPASFLTLPDGVKENFYWTQLYKLASATRADRALIDNTGPWLTLTPWPNAWMNLNVQLTYWALNTSNHLDLAASLENAFYNHTENLRNNLQEPYRKDALGIGRSSNGECVTDIVGVPGVSETAEVGMLPWICHNLWLIYRHKMDDELLKDKLFPLLKGSINYYMYFLRKEADGKLHLPRTYSPEYGSAEDCNFDLSLLRWGCQTLLEICERLKIDDPLIPRWQSTLAELTPYPVDAADGLLIGRDVPYTFSHRHYSHLLAIYPLYLINNEQPGSRELIENSLRHWQSKEGALLGYSLTGASSISSALGKGNDALSYLEKLFGRFLSVNTLYKEAGPVIETPLSGAQSIHDMLLQSWGGKLRIFPAVPDAWQDIAYRDWRAEGAFLIAAGRKGGKTEFVTVKSLAGEPCVIVTDIPSPVFKGDREYKVTTLQDNTYQIDLKKGEEVVIYATGTKPKFEIRPVVNKEINCFGKKKP